MTTADSHQQYSFGYGHQDNINELSSTLPPPKPPAETREELLADKEDILQRMDQHAAAVRKNIIVIHYRSDTPFGQMVYRGSVTSERSE